MSAGRARRLWRRILFRTIGPEVGCGIRTVHHDRTRAAVASRAAAQPEWSTVPACPPCSDARIRSGRRRPAEFRVAAAPIAHQARAGVTDTTTHPSQRCAAATAPLPSTAPAGAHPCTRPSHHGSASGPMLVWATRRAGLAWIGRAAVASQIQLPTFNGRRHSTRMLLPGSERQNDISLCQRQQ